MKQYFCAILFMATACSQNDMSDTPFLNMCGSTSDAIQYPSTWTKEVEDTFVIPDEIIRSMSTCGLLETYYTYPRHALGPWCSYCSSLDLQGVSNFNAALMNDPVVMELFDRPDVMSVLIDGFQCLIQHKGEQRGFYACMEMLLASDLCMSVSNDGEKKNS